MLNAACHEVDVSAVAAIHRVHEAGAREGIDPGVPPDGEGIGRGGGVDAQRRGAGRDSCSSNAGADRHRLQADVTGEHREDLVGGR